MRKEYLGKDQKHVIGTEKQSHVKRFSAICLANEKRKGFQHNRQILRCCLLAEECGEVISAVRKNSKSGSVASDSVAGNVAEELADVFIYVCSLANMHGIDLERAFREKEEKNKRRIWKKL